MRNCEENVQSLLFGCIFCLFLTSVVNADGRVFVLDPGNFSGVQGFRDAQQACTSQNARLASVEELHHAVVECFFSQCTRGWLYGGVIGSAVCNTEGSSLKTVNVRIENVTEDMAHLSAFCIKDKAAACGDPPSFPNARLQEHSGFEMGNELTYTCAPGYVMPSGSSAFSLMCDSCGEWYGTVQFCVRDKMESHGDYEHKFPESHRQADWDRDGSEEVFEGESQDHSRGLPQQETRFTIKVQEAHQDQQKEHDTGGTVISNRRAFVGAKNEEQALMVHPMSEQERSDIVRTDVAATTEEPVSLLSQKHLFWFPSEAFQDEGPPSSTDSAAQPTQRASGAQSQESKENESQERQHISLPVDVDNHDDDQDRYDDQDNDDRDDHNDSRHDDDQDAHEDDHTDDQDDANSHQENDDVKHRGLPDNLDRLDSHENHDDHDDHYDMGEHEDDRDHIRYSTEDHSDRDDAYDEHHSHEEHDDVIRGHKDKDGEDPDVSEEHPDHHDYDDDHDLLDHDTHDDHKDKYHEDFDDHDSHEDDDVPLHVMFSTAIKERSNITQRGAGSKTTKDDTWLDGYPVQETDNGDSTRKQINPEDGERMVKTTDRPYEVEVRKRAPHTSSSDNHEFHTLMPESDKRVVKKVRPGFRTPGSFPEHLQPSDSPSSSDTLDYDTQQAAPTHSWLDEFTDHPFLDHGPAPPKKDGDIFTGITGEHSVHNLPGEMGEAEGEMGETICMGEDCPPRPPNSSSRGPTVAAIIVVVCAVALAAIFGVWCYRRQQQKCSVYEMNEKGQNQTRQGQQMEMQQKV